VVFIDCHYCGTQNEHPGNKKKFSLMCKKCGKWWNYHIFEKQKVKASKPKLGAPQVDMSQWFADKAKKEKEEKKSDFEELIESEENWIIISNKDKSNEDQETYHNVSEIQELSPQIKNGVSKHIPKVSEFQKNSIKKILEGKSTVLSAPTASGKTEAFVIPILQKILQNEEHKGTFCVIAYPTRALAADQVSKINKYAEACGLGNCAFRLDGSVPTGSRPAIVEKCPKIIVTTIDFIHWQLTLQSISAPLFKQAKIFALDEAHSYSGFFGSNVYFVIKRLKKFLKNPQFIAASATLDNELEFCQELFDEKMELVKGKSRKKSLRQYVIRPTDITHVTASNKIVSMFKETDNKFLSFFNSRADAENQSSRLKDGKKPLMVEVHRSGISDRVRQDTEFRMKEGDLEGLCCTSTLELGIDIGSVTGVSSIFTNDLDNFIQRQGRAGRKGTDAYSVMILRSNDPFSHYYSSHIEEYFAQKNIFHIQKDNPIIKKNQEIFEKADSYGLNPDVKESLKSSADMMDAKQLLRKYSIRGMGESVSGINENGHEIDSTPIPGAYTKLFHGGIHKVNSVTYVSQGVKEEKNNWGDIEYKTKLIQRDDLKYSKTKPVIDSGYSIIETHYEKNIRKFKIQYCTFKINSKITSYYEYNEGTEQGKQLSEENLIQLEPENFGNWSGEYTGIKIKFPYEETINQRILHTVSHLIQNAGCKISKCEPEELDEIIDSDSIIIYDNSPNGTNGNSQIIYDRILEVLDSAISLAYSCKCHYDIDGEYKIGKQVHNKETDEEEATPYGGCPNCTFLPTFCKKFNEELDKKGAYEFLKNCTISESSSKQEEKENDSSFNEDEESEKNYQEHFYEKYEKYNDDGGSFTGKCRRCGRFNDSYTHPLCENCELEDFLSEYSPSEREQIRGKARRIIREERRYDDAQYEKRYYKKSNRKEERQEQKEERQEQKEDYYKIFGISETASHKEIKTRWRELVKKYHPDTITQELRKELKEKEGKSPEEKFTEISRAWEVLQDEMKKKYRQSYAN